MGTKRSFAPRSTSSDAKDGDQAHHASQGNADASHRDRHDAADQAERQIGQDQPAVGAPPKGHEQDDHDQGERQRGIQNQLEPGLRLGLGGTGKFDEYASGQHHGASNVLLRLLHHVLQRAFADIEGHADSPLAAVVLDAVSILG
jgi:hypothetical protein